MPAHRHALVAILCVGCTLFAAVPVIAAPAAPEVEMILTDQLLTELLLSFTPFDREIQQDLGTGQKMTFKVKLSNPTVRVTNAAVKARIDYHVRDTSGLVDVKGVATPDLKVVAVPSKGILEARFASLGVSLPGGFNLPLESLLEPFALPGVWTTTIAFGDRKVTAEAHATEITTESGHLRIRGKVTFKPGTGAAARR